MKLSSVFERVRKTTRVILFVSAFLAGALTVGAQSELVYQVDSFELRYAVVNPAQPSVERFGQEPIALSLENGVLSAPAEGDTQGELVTIQLSDNWDGQLFSGSAIQAISQSIVRSFNADGIYGVLVLPDPTHVDQRGRDLRPGGRGTLGLVIWTGEVKNIRTIAKGTRFSGEESINSRQHSRLLRNSPILPAGAEEGGHGSLFHKTALDNYLARVNRHPGRRVEAAVASTDEEGGLNLDYLVTETKPWMVYAQISNTGTESTNEWRQRLGLIHHQLTNNDDVLAIDFVTARLDEANAAFGSYNFPLMYPDKLRLKIFGSWGEFTASDVGQGLEVFEGTSWSTGAELIASPWRLGGFSFDTFLGVQWQDIEVSHRTIGLEGETNLFIPYVGIQLDRYSELATTRFQVRVETNIAGTADTNRDDLPALGRLDTDEEWYLAKADFYQSFFLEPLLFPNGWKDPENWRTSTLAHELAFSARGQYVFDDKRLIPQQQQVVGGFFSVRGYPESIAAGDNMAWGSVEYRFHLARSLKPRSEKEREWAAANPDRPLQDSVPQLFGRPFNFRPDRPYRRPDWNLIVRTFLDVGYVDHNLIRPEEEDRTLVGAGVGLELQLLRHLNIRGDLGFALRDVETGTTTVDRGDTRVNVMATIVW